MSQKPKQPPSTTPTLRVAWAGLATAATFLRVHVRATVAAIAGVCLGAAAVVHYASPIYHTVRDPSIRRDDAIAANALAIAAATQSIGGIQKDIDRRTAARDAQLREVAAKLEAEAAALQKNNKALTVNNIRLDDCIKGQDETNRRLDALTDLLLKQAVGKATAGGVIVPSGDFATSTAGPAPGRDP